MLLCTVLSQILPGVQGFGEIIEHIDNNALVLHSPIRQLRNGHHWWVLIHKYKLQFKVIIRIDAY